MAMKTLEVLLFALAVLTYVHSYNMDRTRSDREIEEFFRRRLPARPLEVRKTDKRGKSARFFFVGTSTPKN